MIGKVESIYSPFHQGEQRMVPKVGDDVRAMTRGPSSFEEHIQTALKQDTSAPKSPSQENPFGASNQGSIPNASNVPLNNIYMAAQRARPYPTTNYQHPGDPYA